jgi:hypothetical protein
MCSDHPARQLDFDDDIDQSPRTLPPEEAIGHSADGKSLRLRDRYNSAYMDTEIPSGVRHEHGKRE